MHAGRFSTYWGFGSPQAQCKASGKSASRYGITKPTRGESKSMNCMACGKWLKRGRRDGRIKKHENSEGKPCPGGRR